MTGTLNPQLGPGGSDFQTLYEAALRRLGEYDAHSTDGDSLLLFMDYANRVIDDINRHPYRRGMAELEYYTSAQTVRDIRDNIIILGMIHYYAEYQGDEKMQVFMRDYRDTMNADLLQDRTGNTRHRMRIVDGGTDPSSATEIIDEDTGIGTPIRELDNDIDRPSLLRRA